VQYAALVFTHRERDFIVFFGENLVKRVKILDASDVFG
jgi:hypothetical protein